MHLLERYDAQPEATVRFARGEVAQVNNELDGLVVALRLPGGDKGIDLGPQPGLAANESIQMSLPGDGGFAFMVFGVEHLVVRDAALLQQLR